MAKKGPKGLSASAAGGKKKKKAFGGKGSDEASNGGGGGGLGVSKGSPAFSAPRTSVRATTHKGRRVLAARESQLVEELKNTLQEDEPACQGKTGGSRWRRRPFVFFFFPPSFDGGSFSFFFSTLSFFFLLPL